MNEVFKRFALVELGIGEDAIRKKLSHLQDGYFS